MLKSLKNFSMYEKFDIKPVNFGAYLNSFMDLVSRDFKEKKITLRHRLGSQPDLGFHRFACPEPGPVEYSRQCSRRFEWASLSPDPHLTQIGRRLYRLGDCGQRLRHVSGATEKPVSTLLH